MSEAAVAGNYAALVGNLPPFKDSSGGSGVSLFDLRTGALVPKRGGEGTGCSGANGADNPCVSADQLVLGSDAVSAVHLAVRDSRCSCTVEQIQASDSTGVHTLDSITQPLGSPTALTNLTLTGDTLIWNNNGAPRSAQLQP